MAARNFASGGPVQHFDEGGRVRPSPEDAAIRAATPTGKMINPYFGRTVYKERGDTAPSTVNVTDQYITDPSYAAPIEEVAAPTWLTSQRSSFDPVYNQVTVNDPNARQGRKTVSTGKPIGYRYDNGNSTYITTDLDGNILSSEERRGNGWDGFRDGVVKPAAIMAATAYSMGAFNPATAAAANPFSLSGGTASFGAGSTAATGSALATAAPGLTAGGLTGTTTASGLAGLMGMESGKAATAVNTGALNTGVGLARGQKPLDALKGGVTAAALSPVGSFVSDSVGGGYMGKLAGSTAVGGLQGVATGRGLVDGAQQGLVAGGIDIAGDYVGGMARNATGNKFAGTAANSLTQSTLKGLPPGATLDSLATQYAAGELKDLTGLDPTVAKTVVSLARGKKVSPIGALTQYAAGKAAPVGSRTAARAARGTNAVGALTQTGA